MVANELIIPKIYNMEFLLRESNKSINMKIFYYKVFFKDQSFSLVFFRNSFVLTIGSSSVKPFKSEMHAHRTITMMPSPRTRQIHSRVLFSVFSSLEFVIVRCHYWRLRIDYFIGITLHWSSPNKMSFITAKRVNEGE